ncbi:hypothetical protein COR50_00220 [Chitinophaga caeni]|uniref:Uncharacterized protein n=1 Tax=Chitinophaga caeni TaxID=2029983 RepID=A0A291QP07_9BACT|nr:hypothetical protein [Chitinophaga caeni]ATL45709.1 hypothetical protein COR50_00220 [Chitinophaga caeni]
MPSLFNIIGEKIVLPKYPPNNRLSDVYTNNATSVNIAFKKTEQLISNKNVFIYAKNHRNFTIFCLAPLSILSPKYIINSIYSRIPITIQKEPFLKMAFNFNTSHNQYYLADTDAPGDTGVPSFLLQTAFDARLAMAEGILGISTGSYGDIRGTISILSSIPESLDDSADYIVEAGISIMKGEIVILDCPDSNVELAMQLPNGLYRVRVS